MNEELLYLSMLINRQATQYELCLARALVTAKHQGISMQEVQESFEELATCIKRNVPLSYSNRFASVAELYRLEV